MARQTSILSSRIRERRRKRRARLAVLLLCLAIVVAGALVSVSRLDSLSISDVQVSGTKMADPEQIKQLVQNDLAGSYAGIFPRKNILIYPARKITADVLGQFPVIKSVALSRDPRTVLTVTVEERKPFALWCGTAPDASVQAASVASSVRSSQPSSPIDESSCLFLDDQGITFGTAPSFSGNAFFEWYGPLATTTPSYRFFGASDFHSLDTALSDFRQAGYDPLWAAVSEGDIRFVVQSGASVLFTEKDFSYDLGKLKSFLTGSVLPSSSKTTLDGVDYLDLRFGNKVYSKMKEAGLTSTSSPSSL